MSEGERQALALRLYDNWQETDTADSLEIYCYDKGYQQGRADNLSEICKQISERVEYWDSCAKAVEKGSNEYKIFISLAKNFDELLEHIK